MATQTERRAPLTRERVLRAAMEMVDRGGVASLSMRKLGESLGVEAMSLYNHVANKDDILDGIADLVYEEMEQPLAGGDWETAIRVFAISAHDALVRHPWSCTLSMSRPRLSAPRLRYMEFLLSCLRNAGFSAEATYTAYHAVDSHILGFTLWQQGHSIDPEKIPDIAAAAQRVLSSNDYPYLSEHIEQHMSEGSHRNVRTFEFKLELILDGLKRMPGAPSI